METQIEIRALTSLAHWKATFADEVTALAKQLAANGATPGRVTLQDYQQAVPAAAAILLEKVAKEANVNVDGKAA